MRQASKRVPDSAEKTVRDIRRATRRHHSAEEKIRIVLEGLRSEDSIAELCRKVRDGDARATLPAVTCSGNRLDQIALRSQFGHWALRSEGVWGVPCLSAHYLLLSIAWPMTGGGFFLTFLPPPALSRTRHGRLPSF